MGVLTIYEPTDLKKVYRVLKDQLIDHPELMDSDFLQDLQAHLQYRASTEGIDLSNHRQWSDWLADEHAPPKRPQLRLVTE